MVAWLEVVAVRVMVACQSTGGPEDRVSPLFGRAPCFSILEVDGEPKLLETIPNRYMAGFSGVGIQVAQLAASKGVSIVVAGSIGPNAYSVLSQYGIKPVTGLAGMKVIDAVKAAVKEVQLLPHAAPPQAPVTLYQPAFANRDFEVKILKLQRQMIQEYLKQIEKRIKELEGEQ